MRSFIKAYKEIDLRLIDAIKADGNMDEILNEREKVIKSIESIDGSKEELKKLFFAEGLDKLDKEIEKALISEKMKVKEEINKIKVAQSAHNGYAMANRRTNLFSRKV